MHQSVYDFGVKHGANCFIHQNSPHIHYIYIGFSSCLLIFEERLLLFFKVLFQGHLCMFVSAS